MLDIDAALKAKGLSDRQGGAEILAVWKQRQRMVGYPTPASIGAKLGKLKKGNVTWWRKQPHALASLAQLLACAVGDLLPEGASTVGAIEFGDFPELAPLLPGQDPCAVRLDGGWLGSVADAAVHQGVHAWIVASPGSGKSLAIRVLRQRYGSRIVGTTVRRLFDAAREAKDNIPLVIEVEGLDAATDEGAFVELTKRTTNVCVLAQSMRPSLGIGNTRWADYRWEMEDDWRERLTRWVQSRLPKPDAIDPDDILEWLAVIDPRGRLFETPGHLMPLLARAYRAGLPRGGNALRDLGREFLAQRLGGDTHEWVRHVGTAAVEQLLQARLSRLDLGLTPLSVEGWAELLPATLAPGPSPQPSASKKRVKLRTPVSTEPSAAVPAPLIAVHRLVDSGVLQPAEAGGFDVPPWIRLGIEREAIVSEVKSDRATWAHWAVEHTRKAAVDDALDTLSPADLVTAARRALAAESAALSTVAAVEALFSAIGRRFITTEWMPTSDAEPVLQDLGRRQLQLLSMVPKAGNLMPFLPLTRHRPGVDRNWQSAWVAEAWTFSFRVGRPKKLHGDPSWTLPGWSESVRLSNAPEQLPRPHAVSDRLLHVARQVVAKCADKTAPDEVHALLLPWVMIDGPARGWVPSKGSRSKLLHTKGLGSLVGDLAQREPADVRVAVSATAWMAALEDIGQSPLLALGQLKNAAPSLRKLVEANLAPDVFAATFSKEAIEQGDIGRGLARLPPRLLRAALPAIARRVRDAGRFIDELAPITQHLDVADLDVLVEFVADRFSGVAAAGRVWQLDADRAMEEARLALSRGAESEAYAWFHSAPRDRCGVLLDALESEKRRSASWATRWLSEALTRAGAEAPRVFAMMGPSG